MDPRAYEELQSSKVAPLVFLLVAAGMTGLCLLAGVWWAAGWVDGTDPRSAARRFAASVDHAAIVSEGRALIAAHKADPTRPSFVVSGTPEYERLPAAIRSTAVSRVIVSEETVSLSGGGTWIQYGLTVVAEGVDAQALMWARWGNTEHWEVAPGLWAWAASG